MSRRLSDDNGHQTVTAFNVRRCHSDYRNKTWSHCCIRAKRFVCDSDDLHGFLDIDVLRFRVARTAEKTTVFDTAFFLGPILAFHVRHWLSHPQVLGHDVAVWYR